MLREIAQNLTTRTPSKNKFSHRIAASITVFLMCYVPSAVFAGPLENALNGFIGYAKSGLGIAFASAILIAIGIAWAFNKIHFGWVVGYCVGMAFIFGGETIVKNIKGWIG